MSDNTIQPISSSQYSITAIESGKQQADDPTFESSRWKNAFIPKTSKSREGKPMCVDIIDDNPNCCASVYDIDAVVEESYECGLQDHPGVKAINVYPRPCVTSAELEILIDELAPMAYKTPDPPDILGIPERLNINEHPACVHYDYESNKFCINLVKDVLKHSYGIIKNIPQKKILKDNFEKVLTYCAEAVEYRFGVINVITNSLPIRKPR